MFGLYSSATEKIAHILTVGKTKELSELDFIAAEISRWRVSPERLESLTGYRYYRGNHDILLKKRMAIGKDGDLEEVTNLPNNIRTDNVYARCVDQKTNYLVGKPITFKSDNEDYNKAVKKVLSKRFNKQLKNVCKCALNGGKAWLFPYINESGELRIKQYHNFEILPFWKDSEHTELDMAVRLYPVEVYEGNNLRTIEKVELFKKEGISRYVYENGRLYEDYDGIQPQFSPYMYITYKYNTGEVEKKAYNWNRIPLICFKANSIEQPLIHRTKSLQDGVNQILSDFHDNTQENARNTILVLENYDGENLGEFRKNLSAFGAVKVKAMDGMRGGVSTLTVEVKAETYKSILSIFKRALIQNARAYDDEDTNAIGEQNSLSILSGYTQLDLDCNEMETEFQESMENLLWFVDNYLKNTKQGDFSEDEMIIVFSRDLHIDESARINNVRASVGLVSKRTLAANHPWVTSVDDELKQLKKEEDEELAKADPYAMPTKKPTEKEMVEDSKKDNANKRPSTMG